MLDICKKKCSMILKEWTNLSSKWPSFHTLPELSDPTRPCQTLPEQCRHCHSLPNPCQSQGSTKLSRRSVPFAIILDITTWHWTPFIQPFWSLSDPSLTILDPADHMVYVNHLRPYTTLPSSLALTNTLQDPLRPSGSFAIFLDTTKPPRPCQTP